MIRQSGLLAGSARLSFFFVFGANLMTVLLMGKNCVKRFHRIVRVALNKWLRFSFKVYALVTPCGVLE